MQQLPKQILSGALHYFRVHPGQWHDRLEKAVAMGLNTIETYVPWNLHEPHRGEFVFDGIGDVEKFIRMAGDMDLHVIVRPGPYICAEWDNGGFPAWLTGLPGIRIRCADPVYLGAVESFFTVLFGKLRPLLAANGGPIIMMQLENEYGSFGNDREYLRRLAEIFRKNDMDVPLFTSDGPADLLLAGGTLDNVMPTVNFGMNHERAFRTLKKFRPGTPEFCAEFWDGWFDHWGKKHQVRPAGDGGEAFEPEYGQIVKRGAHVNLYMFHGGTNFGFTAGANGDLCTDYAPTVTSYDYDAPLSEAGDPTEKFFAAQRILAAHTGNPRIRPVAPGKKIAPAPVRLDRRLPLYGNFGKIAEVRGEAVNPPTLEELGENFGFIHYATALPAFEGTSPLSLVEVNDYAQIWLDGRYLGSQYRGDEKKEFLIQGRPEGSVLELLVENTGRVNYGPFVGRDHKGIAGAVCLGQQTLFHWKYDLLPLTDISGLPFDGFDDSLPGPAFYRGTFELEETADTFLKRPGVKGCVWINGFNLGRYWAKGPTGTLYVPAPVLRKGANDIVVFEQEAFPVPEVRFSPGPDLGPAA